MTDIGDLLIRIDVTTEQLRRQLKSAETAVASSANNIDQKLRKVDSAFDRMGAASRRMNSLMRGGGVLAVFTLMERRLETAANKFKDTDEGARQFSESIDRLGKVIDSGLLAGVQALAPAMNQIARAAEFAALHVDDLQRVLNLMPVFGGIAFAKSLTGPAGATGEWPAPSGASGAWDGPPGYQGGAAAGAAGMDLDRVMEQTQSDSDSLMKKWGLGKEAQDGFSQALEIEQERLTAARQEAQDGFSQALAIEQDAYEASRQKMAEADAALSEQIGRDDLKRVERMNEESQRFGQMFADNLIQASEGGFDSLLGMWARTLQQMLAQAVATSIFQSMFPAGLAGGIGKGGAGAGIFKALGFAKGGSFEVGGSGGPDSQFFPMRLSPGEQVSITPPGKSAGNVVSIVQNNNIGQGATPADVVMAMNLAKQSAVNEIRDMQRRGR